MHVFVFFFVSLLSGCWSLRNMSVRVPVAVRAGDRLRIACDYDLENAALYSVKFYQGDTEFYRFVPKESPPSRVFPLQGIQVDLSRSNSTVVTLDKVQRELTGYYKCEVSADAPYFHTAEQSAPVIVIEEPLLLPRLNVEKSKYAANERIRANCTSEAAFPAANLTWLINHIQLRENPPMIRVHNRLLSDTLRALETSVSMLELEARPGYFVEGKLKLTCLATQYNLYKRNASVLLLEDTPQLAPVMGATAPHSHPESRASLVSTDCTLWLLVFAATVLTR